mgnify:CR=1 FL=1
MDDSDNDACKSDANDDRDTNIKRRTITIITLGKAMIMTTTAITPGRAIMIITPLNSMIMTTTIKKRRTITIITLVTAIRITTTTIT